MSDVIDGKEPEEIKVCETEIRAWFAEQLARKDANGRQIRHSQLASELGVHQTTVSRNAGRMQRGEPFAVNFHKLLRELLVKQQQEEQKQRRLKAERDAESARIEKARLVQEEAERIETARRIAAEKVARKAALRRQQEWERQENVREKLAPYIELLQAEGVLDQGDFSLYGDAIELVEHGDDVSINYDTVGLAAVALAPDEYSFDCGLTAAELRAGHTAKERLQRWAVPAGHPRPNRIGIRPAYFVPCVQYPDAEHFYGEDFAEIQEWSRLAAECAHLASGHLPKFVSPEDVNKFEELIHLESASRYTFEGSVLHEDLEDRLKSLRRRSVLPAIGEHLSGAIPLVIKTLLWLAPAAAAFICIYFYGTSAWESMKSLGSTLASVGMAAVAWIDHWKWVVFSVLAAVAGVVLAIWWVWPKDSDRNGSFAGRLIIVIGIIVIAVIGVWLSEQLSTLLNTNKELLDKFAEAFTPGPYAPNIS